MSQPQSDLRRTGFMSCFVSDKSQRSIPRQMNERSGRATSQTHSATNSFELGDQICRAGVSNDHETVDWGRGNDTACLPNL